MGADGDSYDLVVLGAGPTGENLADRARAGGLTVAIVEHELVGGECSYWACMPSKALLRPAAALADARRLAGTREAVRGQLDAGAVLKRRDEFASHWKDDGQVAWLESVGVDLVRGHGRLDGERRVTVETPDGGRRTLTARHAVAVCTGTRAALPDLPGLAEAKVWTSREATSASSVPGRLAVVGGGVVAVEMACAWRALGSEVTLLVRGDRLLDRTEDFAGQLVADGLREAGVDIRLGVSATAVHRADDGTLTLDLSDGTRLPADEALFATGRVPNTADLGLATVGLTPGHWITTDDTGVATDVPGGWLYAAGDVNHRALLTHQGKYQGRIFGQAIADRAAGRPLDLAPWGRSVATADRTAVPQVVFTDPEVAAVGLTWRQAEDAGLRVRAVDYELGNVSGAALYADGYRGRARAVVDLDRETLVGVTFVGPGVAELLHSATVAIVGEVPLSRLWHAVPAYPTISEVWLRLLETYRG
ncbi:dihydrolipoyl dehydrogenase family protein [Kitasatospora sp. CB01950]|uniref:dihydrolipoyl dehydrogenase family protein n=1 Tax=Kitasatospora sp. CB01950 TaxID=1703930 RepID=UPI000939BCE6|nr:NAD(P)/FAD-dependent oxidoreductase [Kitasatospora sp. CB01950]OKJ13572.1 pyridine nucleotide-disulfide oxidoreductase [Kitasatospora sp. CB01950]